MTSAHDKKLSARALRYLQRQTQKALENKPEVQLLQRKKEQQGSESVSPRKRNGLRKLLPKEYDPERLSDGKLKHTAANFGIQKGQCIHVHPEGAEKPVILRFEEGIGSLPNNDDILKAIDMLESGKYDYQHVSGYLKHEDANTVLEFIKYYLTIKCKISKKEIPGKIQQSKGRLSKKSMQRLNTRKEDPLPLRYLIESCGSWSGGEPILSTEMLSRNSNEIEKYIGAEDLRLIQPTYNSTIEDIAFQWMVASSEVNSFLAARNLRPFACCEIEANESKFKVCFSPHSERTFLNCTNKSFKVLGGKHIENTDSDFAIIMKVSNSLVNSKKSNIRKKKKKSMKYSYNTSNLIRKPTPVECRIKLQLSLIQKSIRRGLTLSSPGMLERAVKDIFDVGYDLRVDGKSAIELLLWRILNSIFADVSPYMKNPKEYLSIPEVLGLALMHVADPSFQVSKRLEAEILETILRLQARESVDSLWPWRGWAIKYHKSKEKSPLFLECTEVNLEQDQDVYHIRNCLRCLIGADLPISDIERDMYKRYLLVGLAKNSVYEKQIIPLGKAGFKQEMDAKTVLKVESETMLASLDHSVYPALMLFFQAALPFVPKNLRQHSTRALEQLVYRLSSGINVRIIKAELQGTNVHNLFRMQQYLGKQDKNDSMKSFKRNKKPVVVISAIDSLNLTSHEKLLLAILLELQREMANSFYENGEVVRSKKTMKKTDGQKSYDSQSSIGRNPTKFESRTAFLQLFGEISYINCKGLTYSAVIAGNPESPFLIKEETNLPVEDKQNRKFLESKDPRLPAIVAELVSQYPRAKQLDFEPPFGFKWKFGSGHVMLDLKLHEGKPTFYINDERILPFDGSSILIPCNVPKRVVPLPKELEALVSETLYSSKKEVQSNGRESIQLLSNICSFESEINPDEVFEWLGIGRQSPLESHIWRDVFLKLIMRNKDSISVSVSLDSGSKFQYSSYEGTCLRVILCLCALYPYALSRREDASQSHSISFRIISMSSAQYVHLVKALHLLAFGFEYENGLLGKALVYSGKRKRNSKSIRLPTRITTELWSHQKEAVARVVKGIDEGKRGFADASTVGSGKTLTALAVIDALHCKYSSMNQSRHFKGNCIKLYGCLVLLPTNSLIDEWAQQVFMHTKGIHVLVQNQQGFLKSRGISSGYGQNPVSAPRNYQPKVEEDCLVITTLARAREHPFTSRAWDLIVVDECLSVQSPALHSFAAWRQVAASTFGVLMLSATFFRSRLSSLFYMIRMLRSALPRTEKYLPALLHEHIILYVPENPRKWTLRFREVELPSKILARYKSLIDNATMPTSSMDPRKIYVSLKQFLKRNYQEELAVHAIADSVEELKRRGRTALVFATSVNEREKLLNRIPRSYSLKDRVTNSKSSDTLILTINEGAQGLNLQNFNAIVTRPQPGDILEQMKGRIDRPNQKMKTLHLVVVFAQDTIEEAEASNIRLCGAFFRQYLDPLSKTFQIRAIGACLKAQKPGKSILCKSSFSSSCKGRVAKAYVDSFLEVENVLYQNEDREDEKLDSGTIEGIQDRTSGENLKSFKRKTLRRLQNKTLKKRKNHKKLHPHVFLSQGRTLVMSIELVSESLYHLAKSDKKLSVVISQVGPPTSMLDRIGKVDPFLALCRSLAFQQLSTKAASTIFNRFQNLCGGENRVTPERVLAMTEEEIRCCGFSRRKVEYAKSLAHHFKKHKLTHGKLSKMTDSEVYDSLIQVRGIGSWSIHMFLMFSLGRSDIFPVGDLVVRKACKRLYNLSSGDEVEDTKVESLPSEQELIPIAESWRPYRSIATWLLWHAVESENCNYTY